jgi:hypothetical protein
MYLVNHQEWKEGEHEKERVRKHISVLYRVA